MTPFPAIPPRFRNRCRPDGVHKGRHIGQGTDFGFGSRRRGLVVLLQPAKRRMSCRNDLRFSVFGLAAKFPTAIARDSQVFGQYWARWLERPPRVPSLTGAGNSFPFSRSMHRFTHGSQRPHVIDLLRSQLTPIGAMASSQIVLIEPQNSQTAHTQRAYLRSTSGQGPYVANPSHALANRAADRTSSGAVPVRSGIALEFQKADCRVGVTAQGVGISDEKAAYALLRSSYPIVVLPIRRGRFL